MKLKFTADEDAGGWTVADAMDPTEVVVVLVMAVLGADDDGMENANGADEVGGAVVVAVEVVVEPKLKVTFFAIFGDSVTGSEDVETRGREGTFGWSFG